MNSALRTKALLDLLEQRAHLDGLTELGNRFALQDTLPLEYAACKKKECPLTVLMADIDHFKRVNDQFGHAAGDEVLRRVAMVLRGSVRPNDFLARYGGEEFVVLCPDCDLATALQTAEKVRAAVSGLKVIFRNSEVAATMSVGVASIESPFGLDATEMLDRADQSLYRAKSSGRDAVWYWDGARKAPASAAEFVAAGAGAGAPAESPAVAVGLAS